MNRKLIAVLSSSLVSTASLLATTASAQNLYTNDLRLRADIDWLNSQGVTQISTSTWPLTANEIKRGLSTANAVTPAQQQMLESVYTTLKQNPNSLVHADIDVNLQTDRQQLPQTFGEDKLAGQQLSGSIGLSEEDLEFNLQVNLKNDKLIEDGSDVSFEGSYVAGGFANQWLIAGQIPAWWGPGYDGSLIRGDASIPVAGFTMQRDQQAAPTSQYLSWVGPWQYQLFAGQLDEYTAVPKAKLFGARLTAQPWPWLEVGASRTFMWGGEGRPESLSSFTDAILGTKDNNDKGLGSDQDPANQLGGFDTRLSLAPLIKVPAGIYVQYIGEDEAGGLPAKNMYLAGVDYASAAYGKPYQLYAEYTDTRSGGKVDRGGSYNHSIYTDGYYQNSYPLGYALGGNAESVAVGGRLWLDNRNFINAKLQHAKVNQSDQEINQAFPTTDKLTAIDVAWEHQLQPLMIINSRVWAVDSDTQSTDIGVGVGIELKAY